MKDYCPETMIDLAPEYLNIVREIFRNHLPHAQVWAFGSRVTWTAKEFSDLDLVIIAEDPISNSVMTKLNTAFSESDLPIKVDLVDWNAISEEFRQVINKQKTEIVITMVTKVSSVAAINPDRINKRTGTERIKYVDISNVDRGQILEYQDIQLSQAPSRAQRLVKPNDIIFSTVRPGNRAFAFIKSTPENLVVSTGYVVLRAEKCDPGYLYYWLTADRVIDYLASIADEKSAYPSVNPSDIGELEIPLPTLETQKEIANILGTLDDKIELNRRMNKTLEEIAQTLFKHWFIDFEFPNEEGKPYKSSGGEMIDSELGQIPKGWRVGKISDIAYLSNEISHPKDCPDAKYIGLEHINGNSFSLNGFGIASDTVSGKRVFRKSDILFGKLRPYFRKIIMAQFDGVCSTDIWVIRPVINERETYLFQVLVSQQFVDFVSSGTEGSRMPRANWNFVSKYQVIIPEEHVILHFCKQTRLLHALQVNILEENETLAQYLVYLCRDFIL